MTDARRIVSGACALLLAAVPVHAGTLSIPSGSMKPTLLVGDVISIEALEAAPERGDVLVFRHPVTDELHIARLIGLPGEAVQMVEGVPVIDGTSVQQEAMDDFEEIMAPQGTLGLRPRCSNDPVPEGWVCIKHRAKETLPGGRVHQVLDIGPLRLDNTAVFTVPDGHLFVMGDNRDNAMDSRVPQAIGGPGFIPEGNALATVTRILYNTEGHLDRIMKGVE